MKETTYKKPSLFTATRTLQRFFANREDTNSITKEDMIAAWGRDKPEYEKGNDAWLSGKLTAIYAHSLARPVYSFNPWRKLERLELTGKGKIALNRDDAPSTVDGSTAERSATAAKHANTADLTLDDILAALPRINEKLTTHRVRVVLEEVTPTE